jgi:hypothetical protein
MTGLLAFWLLAILPPQCEWQLYDGTMLPDPCLHRVTFRGGSDWMLLRRPVNVEASR